MVAAGSLLGACTTADRPDIVAHPNDKTALLPGASWIATAAVPVVDAFADPKDATPTDHLTNPDEYGTPLTFLVDTNDADGKWLPVMLPVRPNGTRAWIHASDVTLAQTQYRINVELTAHTLKVMSDDDVVLTTQVGVGKDSTPTPGGTYYIKELLEPPNPDTVYGPYVFGLSGFSNVLTSMNGDGQGVIGIHGNNDPSSIGQNVSHGCIRVPNDVITRMATFLPLGTPVDILE
ncbi:MAG TPA: L,D-transpeptidase [Acidimicrobiales bacterium]